MPQSGTMAAISPMEKMTRSSGLVSAASRATERISTFGIRISARKGMTRHSGIWGKVR